MENESDDSGTIYCLPSEVIVMILEYNNCSDIISFASTCKEFYETVTTNQHLWKDIYKKMFPKDICDLADSHGDGDWFNEVKRFYGIKQQIFTELLTMSPKYYWHNCEVALEELTFFFDIAFEHSMNLYYVVFILQSLVRKGNEYIKQNLGKKLYTMTDLYYAKVILRHLIQTCLTVKWVQSRMNNELPPERLVNFFLQWVDMENMHWDEDVAGIIKALGARVESILLNSVPTKGSSSKSIQKLCEAGSISEKQVLTVISDVIYQQERMSVTSSADFDLIDIKKIFKDKCGNVVVVAAVYQAVAKLFGVECELIAFPNHLFLEWRSPGDQPNASLYTIDLETGQLHLKRRCPFSQTANSNLKYCPDSLLQYICSTFLMTMGVIKNWNTQNAVFLLDFLSTNINEDNPYRNFLPYLLDRSHMPALNVPINMKYLSDIHREILKQLTKINKPDVESNVKNKVVKTRDSRVKYAVGMVCYHREYEYACIIRDWDLSCTVEHGERLSREMLAARHQPYYKVTAADQSDRYIAQDKLIEASQPTRLYTLEDIISAEFTHFNGFSYVPNSEKLSEYPHDIPVANMYASRERAPRVAASRVELSSARNPTSS